MGATVAGISLEDAQLIAQEAKKDPKGFRLVFNTAKLRSKLNTTPLGINLTDQTSALTFHEKKSFCVAAGIGKPVFTIVSGEVVLKQNLVERRINS
jgi:hypothetical protein